MNQSRYQLTAGERLTTFEFISEGKKGQIKKLIQFTPTNYKDVYNLAFGDKHPITGEIDDAIISNNGDSEKILLTVAAAVRVFTDKNPEALIYAVGSTHSRTRLYRMGITKYFSELSNDFEIFGQINEDWEIFRKNIDYNGFLAMKKNS